MTEREPSSGFNKGNLGRPALEANKPLIAYGRKMGMKDARHMADHIRALGGVEKLSKLTPEVQRILLGVSQ